MKPLAGKKFKFTSRQEQVAFHYAKGESQKKIAGKLSCSASNVARLSSIVRAKIGAENQTETIYILSHYRFA